jgi:hypothetical protein
MPVAKKTAKTKTTRGGNHGGHDEDPGCVINLSCARLAEVLDCFPELKKCITVQRGPSELRIRQMRRP